MSSTTHISPVQDTGGNVNYLPNSCNISDISMISVYWSDIMNKPGFCNVSITGSYNDLSNVPSLSTVAFSGDYNSLSNRPWINVNSNIYNNNQGNIGIGTDNPTEKLHLIGNFSIAGNIIPAINSNFNLGSSNYKWKDLYLSGNSIYLDELIISKNNSNNLEIRDRDNNLKSISLNQLELNDGDNKLRFLYSNGALSFNSNGVDIRGIEFSNYPNIIYSNNLYNTSNSIIDYTNYRINNLNFNSGESGGGGTTTINISTDTIQIGSSNNFITSNTYSSNITFTNNLNVNGSYQLNSCNIPFSLMKYTNISTNNGVFAYNGASNEFGFFSFISNGFITFPQATNCDVLVVGAGGNGGSGVLSGGGGAGEVIAYPSYPFPAGTYSIQVGIAGTSSNNRISEISSNSIDLLLAKGGADGFGIQSNITSTILNYSITNSNSIVDYNYSNLTSLPVGTSNFLFTNDGAIITTSKDYSTISAIPNPNAWYRFDNSANLGLDSSTNAHNLTTQSIVAYNTNSVKGTGSAYVATATAGQGLYTTAGVNLSLKSWSISLWIYPTTNSSFCGYVGYGSTTAASRVLGLYYSNKSYYIDYNGVDYNTSRDSSLVYDDVNSWVHIVYIHIENATDSLRNRRIYRNGIKILEKVGTGGCIESSTRFGFFARQSDYSIQGVGYIDDVRVYNSTVLTDAQVLELFNSTVDRSYPILRNTNNQVINPYIWYKFDNNATDMLLDSSSNGFHMYNSNATFDNTSTNYTRGNGSLAVAKSKYLSIPKPIPFKSLQLNNGFSISLWYKGTAAGSDLYGRVFQFSDSGQTLNGTIALTSTGSGQTYQPYFYVGGAGYAIQLTDNQYFNNSWYHSVWTLSTTGNFLVYINGIYKQSLTGVNLNNALADFNAIQYIGGSKQDGDQRHLNGNIDDFRIYDFVLTAAQVQELYKGRVRIFGSSLNIQGGCGGGGFSDVNLTTAVGSKWDSNYSYLSSGYLGTSNQGGNGGGAFSNIGLTTSLVTGASLIVGEGGNGATLTSTPSTKTIYGSGGDGNGGIGANGIVIIKVPLNTCNVKFDGFIYSSNIFDLNYNTITLMSFASNQLNSSIVAASNKLIDYDNLVDKPWINSNLIIYNNNLGNVGIGTNNPLSKLDVSGDINFTGTLRLNQRSLPFSVYSNTNIIGSNGLFTYIPNNPFFGYYTYLTNGSITFPQTTSCDIVVVGAGGNGGTSSYGGGGGAGEVIVIPSYSFPTGTYNIQIGNSYDFSSCNFRNSIISSNNSNLITAKGGGDGVSFFNFIAYTYTGTIQTFTVPVGVSTVNVYCWGAGGGGSLTYTNNLGGIIGGSGSYVKATLNVSALSTLNIIVGQGGATGQRYSFATRTAFGGGAPGVTIDSNNWAIGGGGGFSGVFSNVTLVDNYYVSSNSIPVLIAGGGGGAGAKNFQINNTSNHGGNAGSNGSNASSDNIGFGGTVTTGGIIGGGIYRGGSNIYSSNLITSNTNNAIFTSSNLLFFNYDTPIRGLDFTSNSNIAFNDGEINTTSYDSSKFSNINRVFKNNPPWGVYFAEDWRGTTLFDISGNNRNATTAGTITKTTASGNGASAPITYISGATTSTITWPSGSIPQNLTILALTRYSGATNQGRILATTSGAIDFVFGHYSLRGPIFLNNWVTSQTAVGTSTDWLCAIAKTGGSFPNNVLLDGVASGIATAPALSSSYNLTINSTAYPKSDFAFGCVMIWDKGLNDADMVTLNGLINDWKSGLVNPRIFFPAFDYNYPILRDLTTGEVINPLLWYQFDGNATTMLNDSSGNGYTLTNYGTTFDSTNYIKSTGSVNFVASSSQYLSMPVSINFNQINTNTGITFSFWAKRNTSSNRFARIFEFTEWAVASLSSASGIAILNDYQSGSTNITYFNVFKEGGSTSSITINNLVDNKWHHYVWSISNTGVWNIYIDNVCNLFNSLQQVIPALTRTGRINYFIGKTPDGNFHYLDGNLDDFRIYQKVLTPQEVNILYNNRYVDRSYSIIKRSGTTLNPVAWYRFDTDVTTDSSGNGYTLTNTGSTAVNFTNFRKGTGGSADLGSANNLTSTNATLVSTFSQKSFSISLWAYPRSGTNGLSFYVGTSTSASIGVWVGFGINTGNTYGFSFFTNDLVSSGYSGDVNTWVYLTFTYNSTTTDKRIYRNGLQIATNKDTSPTISTNTLTIGRIGTSAGYPMNGLVDDFRIYNQELTAAEVMELYQGRVDVFNISGAGAGGGGGYYGGGAGNYSSSNIGGGGGGASFVNTSTFNITNVTILSNATNGILTAPGNNELLYQSNIAIPGTQTSDGGNGLVIIELPQTVFTNIGSGGGGYINTSAQLSGTKWNNTFSLMTNGSNGTATRGGNGGSALSNIGYTETITSNSFILGVGGLGATSNSVPSLKTTYGSGGDGNGGLGTQGIVIIKVPLNIQRPRFDGYINYSNIDNRPVLNDLLTTNNYLNIGYYNQVNFPLADVSWNNEWFLYIGRSPTSVQNSFIFWHLTSNINSKWWFNGTQTSTNNEISDARIKKEITEIQNPLDKLMLIQPKEYYLCDEKDYLKKYGVIAQDVASNQELSHLVYKDEDFIANVYTTATYVSSPKFLLITTTSIIGKVAVDDELKLLLDNMNIDNIEIIIEETPYHNRYKKRYVKVKEIIDEFTIEIYEEIEITENEKSNILIYGKKVNDFNKLDYSSLYSLNIACTQELYKLIQQQKNKIDELEQRIIQLENR